MNLNHLAAFSAIAETGSFSKAAEKLFKTQAAISIAIKNLEDSVGFTLINRERNPNILTEKGHAFFLKSRILQSEHEQLKQYAMVLASDLEPNIYIEIDSLAPQARITEIIARIAKQYPQTYFSISIGSMGGPLERLLNKEVGLILAERVTQHPHLESHILFDIPMLPVCSKAYFDTHQKYFEHNRLLKMTTQIIHTSSKLKQDVSFGIYENTHKHYVDNANIKKTLIEKGVGWGRLPQYMIEDALKSGDLIHITSKTLPQDTVMPLSIIRERDAPRGKVYRALWNALSTQ